MSQPLLIALLALLWLGALVWHMQENKSLSRELVQNRMPTRLERKMLRLAWGRTFQLLLVLGFMLGIFGIFQWRLEEVQGESQARIAQLSASNKALEEQQAQQKPAAPVALSPAQETVSSVFEPAEAASPYDALKKRYEELYVNYLYLTRCGLTGYDGYQVLNAALTREAAAAGAPASLQGEITEAARGTYQEVYQKTPCDTAQARESAIKFNAYLTGLRQQGSVPAGFVAPTAPAAVTPKAETPQPAPVTLPQENGGIPPGTEAAAPPEPEPPPAEETNPVGAPVALPR